MPLIQGSTSIAASGVNDNVLSGSQYEYLPWPAMLEIGLTGDANGADLRVDVYSGSDVLLENAPMSVQNRIPIYPDDFNLVDGAQAGERIKIRARNTSAAGARTLFHAVKITPL
jgi:hypothetical protein